MRRPAQFAAETAKVVIADVGDGLKNIWDRDVLPVVAGICGHCGFVVFVVDRGNDPVRVLYFPMTGGACDKDPTNGASAAQSQIGAVTRQGLL